MRWINETGCSIVQPSNEVFERFKVCIIEPRNGNLKPFGFFRQSAASSHCTEFLKHCCNASRFRTILDTETERFEVAFDLAITLVP
jgi:hypothetical protein